MEKLKLVSLIVFILITIACVYPHKWDKHDDIRADKHNKERSYYSNLDRSKEAIMLENDRLQSWLISLALALWIFFLIVFK